MSQDEELDENKGEMGHNLAFARDAANEFSEQFRKKNTGRYEELTKQKFVQLILSQVLANSESIQKRLLKPDFILTSQIEQRDVIKEKVKDEGPLTHGIVHNNQVAPGDINSKSPSQNQKSSY